MSADNQEPETLTLTGSLDVSITYHHDGFVEICGPRYMPTWIEEARELHRLLGEMLAIVDGQKS